MADTVREAAERVAMGIRTGSNGQLSATVEWMGAEAQRVHVAIVGAGKLGALLIARGEKGPDANFDGIAKPFVLELVVYVVKGLNSPYAELCGRDVARAIIEQERRETDPGPVTALLAGAALSADTRLGKLATDATQEQFARGVLRQAEQMVPGLGDEVRAKLSEDRAALTSPALQWLVRGAGLVLKRGRGRPRRDVHLGPRKPGRPGRGA